MLIPEPQRVRRAVWFASVVFFAAFYAVLVVLPIYLAEARLGEGSIAVVLGGFGIAGLVARPLAGRCTDRFGARAVSLIGVLLFSGATVAVLWTHSVALLTLLRGAQAAGYVGFTTGATSMVALATDPLERPQAMARYGTAANVAMASAPLATNLLADTASTRWLLLAIAAVGGLAIPMLLVRRADGSWRPEPATRNVVVGLRSSHTGMALFLLTMVFGVGFGTFLQFMPVLAHQREQPAGAAFTTFAIAIVVTRMILARRPGPASSDRLIAPALILLAGGLTLCSLASAGAIMLLASAVVAAACGVLHPTLLTLQLGPARATGRGVARFYLAFDIGIGLGAWLLAAPASHWGVDAAFVVSAALLIACALAGWAVRSLSDQAFR